MHSKCWCILLSLSFIWHVVLFPLYITHNAVLTVMMMRWDLSTWRKRCGGALMLMYARCELCIRIRATFFVLWSSSLTFLICTDPKASNVRIILSSTADLYGCIAFWDFWVPCFLCFCTGFYKSRSCAWANHETSKGVRATVKPR